MKDNNKKRIKVFTLVTLGLVVLFLFAGGYYIKKNLENIVNYAINKGLDYNLKIENIETNKFGTLTGRNIILNDKKGQRVLEIPEVVIKYNFRDIIDGRYISELWAKNPTIYLTISKVTQTNIMSALNLDKKKKSSAPSPLKYIKVSDGILYYNDISYKKPIKMKLKGVEGSIDLKKLLKLNFSGSGFDDETEKLSFGIKEVKKGKTSDLLVSQVDWLASLASLTGAVMPKGTAPDSYNFLGSWLGKEKKDRPWVIEQASNHTLSVRTKDWKYIEPNGGPKMIQWGPKIETGNSKEPQLYKMEEVKEVTNYASQMPEKVAELQTILQGVREGKDLIGK